MPMIAPQTAVACSHSSICAPSGASTLTPQPDLVRTSSNSQPGPKLTEHLVGGAGGEVRGGRRLDDDRQHALAVLAGRLGDQLLGPVAEAGVRGLGVAQHELVDAGQVGHADQGAQAQAGVVDGVLLEVAADRLGLGQQRADVGAGQPARHQAEGGQRGEPAADGRVGAEDAVARLGGRLVERRARVGDDDDPLAGVDAGVGERLLVGAALAVGLDGAAGLATRRPRRCGRGRCRWPCARSRGRRSRARRARRRRRRRSPPGRATSRPCRTARPGSARRRASSSRSAVIAATSGWRGPGQVDPAEPLGRLVLGGRHPTACGPWRPAGWRTGRPPAARPGRRRPPRRGSRRTARSPSSPATVFQAVPASAAWLSLAHDRALSSWPSMVSTSSCQDFSNFSTPSRSSTASTSSKSIPTSREPVEHGLARRPARPVDLVALDLAVVGEGLEGLLRHRVDGVGDDEVGDVLGVGVALVLDAGRGPQRPLGVGAGLAEGGEAVAAEDLLVRRVGEPGVGDRGLAAERVGLVGADLVEPLVDLGVDAGDEERGHGVDRREVDAGCPWRPRARRGRRPSPCGSGRCRRSG